MSNKTKITFTLTAAILILAALTVYSLYAGCLNIIEFWDPISDVETYSRFNFALIPMGIFTLITTIICAFFFITGERWEDRYGGAIPLSSLAFVGIAFVLILITPSIYESKYEKAGLQACSGTPIGHLPFYAKRFAADPSLCRK